MIEKVITFLDEFNYEEIPKILKKMQLEVF